MNITHTDSYEDNIRILKQFLLDHKTDPTVISLYITRHGEIVIGEEIANHSNRTRLTLQSNGRTVSEYTIRTTELSEETSSWANDAVESFEEALKEFNALLKLQKSLEDTDISVILDLT